MRTHFTQVRIVALCVSLLAALAPTLAGCGRVVCNAMYGPPPHAALTVNNGVVYGVGAGKFFAIRASDGKALWQNSENPYNISGSYAGQFSYWQEPVAPVVDGQTVIETLGVGLIVALRATDGKMLWHSHPLAVPISPAYNPASFPPPAYTPTIPSPPTDTPAIPPPSAYNPASPPPVVADGVIYATVGFGSIAALSEDNGNALWVAPFASDAEATPARSFYLGVLPRPVVAGNAVYVSIGRSVYALRTRDGATLWSLPDAPADVSYSTPVVAANTVYVVTSRAVFTSDASSVAFALDAQTGAIRWRAPERAFTVLLSAPSSTIVRGPTVYIASQGSLAQALDAATGAQLWSYQTQTDQGMVGGALAPLVVEDGRVYLASLHWGLFALDAATGRVLWRGTLDNSIFDPPYPNGDYNSSADALLRLSTPEVDQGTVVLVAANGAAAWNILHGQRLWETHIPNQEDSAFVQSAAVADGAVYMAQGGTQRTCGFSGLPPRVLALRETDGAKLWQVAI